MDIHPHPLLIDHVVENILQSVEPLLLGHYCKIFRLVCKDWSTIATRVYKSHRGKIVFKKNFIGKVSGLFIRVMKTSADVPFDKFKFCYDSYDEEYFSELLHVCSGAISSLELSFLNPSKIRFPKQFPNLILGRLRTLVFHVRVDCIEPLQTEMSSLLQTLFEISPRLETLDLKILVGTPRTPINILQRDKVIKNFGDTVAHHLPSGIRTLKMHITLAEEQLRELTKRELKIRNLDVYFQQSELSAEALELFFSKFAPTLIKCRAMGNQFLKSEIKFPKFPNLLYLSALGKSPGNINYQRMFPSLEKLEICLWDSLDDILSPNCYSTSLKHIEFPYHIWTGDILVKVGNCFPNLKKLTGITICSVDALKSIFRSVRTLEVLDVRLGNDFQKVDTVDFAFTGMSELNHSLVEKFIKDPKENLDSVVRPFPEGESLRDLKELRHFSITTHPLTNPSKIKLTDITVYYGVMQLKYLLTLKLDYFPISTTALELLQKEVRLKRPV